jgi:hypothetical protein
MKALLFVQTGDARPTRFKQYPHEWAASPDFLNDVRDYADNVKCDRWWLVECENAKAGRTIIRGIPGHMHTGNDCNTCSSYQFNGRILACDDRP